MATTKQTKKSRQKRKRRIAYTLLVVFVVFLLLYYLVTRPSGDISIVEKGVGTAVTPIQNAFSSITEFFKSWFGTSKDTNAQDELEQLRIDLELMQIQLNGYNELEVENERLKTALDAREEYEALDPLFAKVIAKDTGLWFETFTLNKGQNDGVMPNMAVVNAQGLIGRINTVGYNYSTVISIIDSRSSVASLIGRTRDNGMLQGALQSEGGETECRMYYLTNLANVKVGDQVFTSGLDSRFPKGLLIGTVTAVSRSAQSSDKYVSVLPSVNFSSIEEVFILREQVESIDDLQPVPTPTPNPIVTVQPTATTNIYAYSTQSAVDDNAIYHFPTPTPDPNVTPTPSPTPKPTKPVPEAAWLNYR